MKIGFIAGYKEIGEKVKAIAEEMGIQLCYYIQSDGSPRAIIQMARRLIDDGCEALLVRDPLRYLMNEGLNIPIQCLDISTIDIVRAIQKAPKGKTVTYLVNSEDDELYYDYQAELSELSGRKVRYFTLDSNLDYDEAVIQTEQEINKADVLITSAIPMAKVAEGLGKEIIFISASKYEITNALNNLSNVLQLLEKDTEYLNLLKLIIRGTEKYYIATRAGKVLIASEAIQKQVHISGDEIRFQDETEFFKKLPYYEDLKAIKCRGVFTYLDIDFFADYQKVPIGDETLTVYTFKYVSKLQNDEHLIRQSKLQKGFVANYRFSNIISKVPEMDNCKKAARQYAKTNSNILIIGESGTGKEMFAQSIHRESNFSKGPFVAVNCAALPSNLLESELFGYAAGAFTGARSNGKIGFFELSHNGTLFLDEIGEIPIEFQGKLLRALQEKQIFRVGGENPIPVHNRIICATNKDLFSMVQAGLFREDLLYRINVLRLTVPPLRNRKEDILEIAKGLLSEIYQEEGKFVFVPDKYLSQLYNYEWPGNVRQLKSFLQRLVAISEKDINGYTFDKLFADERQFQSNKKSEPESSTEPSSVYDLAFNYGPLEDIEKEIIQKTLAHCDGNVGNAANLLGISRSSIWRKTKE